MADGMANASLAVNQPATTGTEPALFAVKLSMGLGGLVLVLLMLFGLCMRLAQGGLLSVEPTLFYEIMTAHGAGMVGTAALTGAGIMWFFLSRPSSSPARSIGSCLLFSSSASCLSWAQSLSEVLLRPGLSCTRFLRILAVSGSLALQPCSSWA